MGDVRSNGLESFSAVMHSGTFVMSKSNARVISLIDSSGDNVDSDSDSDEDSISTTLSVYRLLSICEKNILDSLSASSSILISSLWDNRISLL